jgi:hypothetical protein
MDEAEKQETCDEDMRNEGNPFGPLCDGHEVRIQLPLKIVTVPVTSARTMLTVGILIGICWTLVISTVWD